MVKSIIRFCLCVVVLLGSARSWAGELRMRYIYVLDWSKSMWGYNGNEDVWERTRSLLLSDLRKREKSDCEVLLLRFDEQVYPAIQGAGNAIDFLENASNRPDGSWTNTLAAWKEALKWVENEAYTQIIVCTDGKPNLPPGTPAAKLQAKEAFISYLRNGTWGLEQARSKGRLFLCYVRLAKAAHENDMQSALEGLQNVAVVDGIRFPAMLLYKGAPLVWNVYAERMHSARIPVNLLNGEGLAEPLALSVSVVGKGKDLLSDVKAVLYPRKGELEISGKSAYSQQQLIKLDSLFHVAIVGGGVGTQPKIVRPIALRLFNRHCKSAKIGVSVPEAIESYKGFITSAEKPALVPVDIALEWSKDAQIARERGTLSLSLVRKPLFGDCEPVALERVGISGDMNQKSVRVEAARPRILKTTLSLPDDFADGTYELGVCLEAPGCEFVQPEKQIVGVFTYSSVTNPLKVQVIWGVVVLLSLLLLWVLILRRLLFPPISRASKVQVVSPMGIKTAVLRGRYKVVFCNRKRRQGLLSRFIYGRIDYNNVGWVDAGDLIFCKSSGKHYPVSTENGRSYGLPLRLEKGVEYRMVKQSASAEEGKVQIR